MGKSFEKLTSSPIIQQKTVGRTTILFTQKALAHILQQHSFSHACEKARKQGKLCFSSSQEILDVGGGIVQFLTDDLERRRQNKVPVPSHKSAPISYLPYSKNLIVQLKPLAPHTFEIVSFYQKRDLKPL